MVKTETSGAFHISPFSTQRVSRDSTKLTKFWGGMADFIGTESNVTMQKSLFSANGSITDDPDLSNGGGILNLLDPEAVGWNQIRELATTAIELSGGFLTR